MNERLHVDLNGGSVRERTCVDLFSGLGCFSIAACANGVRTIAMCESDPFLRQGLESIWRVPVWPDIKTFDAAQYAGAWAVLGGPPCQPASLAGKRRGAGDDRWLWPQTIFVCEVIKPAWFCFENPPGIDGVGLDGIISQLEGIGYEVQAIRIPACAVDSPQDRDRFWILGHANSPDGWRGQPERGPQGRVAHARDAAQLVADGQTHRSQAESPEGFARTERARSVEEEPLADSAAPGSEGSQPEILQGQRVGYSAKCAEAVAVAQSGQQHDGRSGRQLGDRADGTLRDAQGSDCGVGWQDYEWIEFAGELYRAPVGLHELADECAAVIPKKFRSRLIGALGNAIIWQIPAQIISAMIQSESL